MQAERFKALRVHLIELTGCSLCNARCMAMFFLDFPEEGCKRHNKGQDRKRFTDRIPARRIYAQARAKPRPARTFLHGLVAEQADQSPAGTIHRKIHPCISEIPPILMILPGSLSMRGVIPRRPLLRCRWRTFPRTRGSDPVAIAHLALFPAHADTPSPPAPLFPA